MTMAGYKYKVSKGITGWDRPHCVPAAIEQVTDRRMTKVSYEAYDRYVRSYTTLQKIGGETLRCAFRDTLTTIAQDIGLDSYNNFVYAKVERLADLKRTVNKLVRRDYGITLDVTGGNLEDKYKDSHSVGLVPIEDDYFKVVGSWVPRPLHGIVELDDIYQYLNPHEDTVHLVRYPFADANITAIPPAA
jgi:hypothetical protein